MADSVWVLRTTKVRISAAASVCPEVEYKSDVFETSRGAEDHLQSMMRVAKRSCETFSGRFMTLTDNDTHRVVIDEKPGGTIIIYDYRIMKENIY